MCCLTQSSVCEAKSEDHELKVVFEYIVLPYYSKTKQKNNEKFSALALLTEIYSGLAK